MHPIAQIAKPGIRAFTVVLLDAGVVVGGRDHVPGDTDPVLRAAVLERDRRRAVVGQVLEFLAVAVGEVEEVGPRAFGDGHGAEDGAEVGPLRAQQGDLERVGDGVEVCELLFFGGRVVPLVFDGGVRGDVGLGGLRHGGAWGLG